MKRIRVYDRARSVINFGPYSVSLAFTLREEVYKVQVVLFKERNEFRFRFSGDLEVDAANTFFVPATPMGVRMAVLRCIEPLGAAGGARKLSEVILGEFVNSL